MFEPMNEKGTLSYNILIINQGCVVGKHTRLQAEQSGV